MTKATQKRLIWRLAYTSAPARRRLLQDCNGHWGLLHAYLGPSGVFERREVPSQ
jgi:hypothetical protein